MKKVSTVIALLLVISSSYCQKKIKKVEVNEIGFNIQVNLIPVINEIAYNGLKLTLTPISPDELNAIFIKENTFNGKFEYSHFEESRNDFFLSRRKRNIEKSDFEFLLEGTEWLLAEKRINQQEFDELRKQIILNYDQDAGNVYSQDNLIVANPYYIGNKYLSVFEIQIENTSNTSRIFDSNIVVESGNQLLTSLTLENIVDLLKNGNLYNTTKQQSLMRHQLPNTLFIPPQSKIIKYIAVLPIDNNNDDVALSVSGADEIARWVLEKNEARLDQLYTYYELDVSYSYDGNSSWSGINFSYLINPQQIFVIDNDLLYIDENHLSEMFEIITLSLYSDKLYYSRTYTSGDALIDFDRNRRSEKNIDTQQIEELEKKIKQ